jgi:hypothetical protein
VRSTIVSRNSNAKPTPERSQAEDLLVLLSRNMSIINKLVGILKELVPKWNSLKNSDAD